jgi:hypothetical protein
MSTKYRQVVTWNGYPADLVKSGLQKYIRRQMTEKALFCVAELDLFKEAPEKSGEPIRTNLFNRLLITYMEDVANLSILEEVNTRINFLYENRKKSDSDRVKEPDRLRRASTRGEEIALAELVALLSESKKARVCSHIRAVFNPFYFKSEELVNAYPSLQNYWNEIALQKDLESLCSQFLLCLKKKSILAVYYACQIATSKDKLQKKIMKSSRPVWFIFSKLLEIKPEITQIFMHWFKTFIDGMKEDFLCWLLPLLHVLEVVPLGEKIELTKIKPANPRENGVFTFDDFVADRHTKKGRNKSLVEFALVGAFVENQAEFVNPLWKDFYEDGKRFEEDVKLVGEDADLSIVKKAIEKSLRKKKSKTESETFRFIVRTQLTTSGSKQDVYFAENNKGKFVVVKGPYQTRKEIDILVSNTEWKKKHGLPFIPFKVHSLLPDRWTEGVALGVRNKVKRDEACFFLEFDSVISKEKIVIKKHSSKLWPETDVVDWEKIGLHFDFERKLTDLEMTDYVSALLYRYVLGISDIADRNFLVVNGRVISIDEDVEDHIVNLAENLRKKKAEFIYRWLEKKDFNFVNSWEAKKLDALQQKRLEEIKNSESLLALFQL